MIGGRHGIRLCSTVSSFALRSTNSSAFEFVASPAAFLFQKRTCVTSSRLFNETKQTETKVTVARDEAARRLPQHAINWEDLKRSWKYILGDMKNRFASTRTQEQTRRYLKDDHIVYYFREPHDLTYWYISTDEEGGGYSWAELRPSRNEMTALFRGYLSEKRPRDMLLPDDPLHKPETYHGFVYLETKPFKTVLDRDDFMSLGGFNVIKLRLRGDGRKYNFELMCDIAMGEYMMFTAPVYTNGGPLWQEVSIPYTKMISSKKSGFTTAQEPIDVNKVRNFRFLLSDGIEGPFQLEIDYIALAHDKTHFYDNNDNYDPWRPINAGSG